MSTGVLVRALSPGSLTRLQGSRVAGSARSAQVQGELPLPKSRTTWGGRRTGAGRKPGVGRRNVAHRARPQHAERHPVHVTLRSAFRPLRSQHVFPTLCLAIRGATLRAPERFRVVHFSVQWDHVHLVVEAKDEHALSAGVRGLAVRIARYVNELVSRKGRFWADRWHGRALTSPRQVRNVLVYVFGNFRKHARRSFGRGVDAYSSAVHFDGFGEFQSGTPPPLATAHSHAALGVHVVVNETRTWLVATGWRRLGLIGIDEKPRATDAPRNPNWA